jgi:hypothetical protein
VVINKVDGQIICSFFTNGGRHDFRLFKKLKLKIYSKIKAVMDTGYIGIQKFHVNLVLLIKRGKKKLLSKTDKEFNRKVSSEWVLNEQIIGLFKRFKIVPDRYCNRRNRFVLRFNFIVGICNREQKT